MRSTNRLESYITENPFGESDECAKFVIDNVSNPFILHDIIEIGQQYTIGFWAKSEAEGNMAVQGVRIPLTTEWKRHVIVFKAKKENLEFLFEAVGTHYIFRTKLESGNKATDWMPSPEDTEAEITNIREITTSHTTQISTMQGQISALIAEDTIIKGDYDALVSRYNSTVADVDSIKTTIGEHTTLIDSNAQDILAVSTKANTLELDLNGTKSTVTAIQTDLTGVKSRVSVAESVIEQHANEISLMVKETDVTGDYLVAKINLSSTSATIEAKHINLIGAVTAECIATKAVKAQNIDIEDLFSKNITATNMTIEGTSTFKGDVYAKYLEAQAVNVGGDFKVRWDYFDATAFGIGMSGNADGTALGHIELYSDAVNEYGCIVNFGLQLNEKVYAAKEIECANNIKATDFKTGEGISLTDMYEKMKPDYVKAYRSGSNITCTKSFSIIPLSLQSKYGDTFEFLSDGTIEIKKACHLDVSAQVYFTTGFTSGDWIAIAICCNGNVNVRTGQYVDRANPYLMLAVSTKISMSAGETISLVAMNETGARGTINTGVSDTFLHANVIAYT